MCQRLEHNIPSSSFLILILREHVLLLNFYCCSWVLTTRGCIPLIPAVPLPRFPPTTSHLVPQSPQCTVVSTGRTFPFLIVYHRNDDHLHISLLVACYQSPSSPRHMYQPVLPSSQWSAVGPLTTASSVILEWLCLRIQGTFVLIA